MLYKRGDRVSEDFRNNELMGIYGRETMSTALRTSIQAIRSLVNSGRITHNASVGSLLSILDGHHKDLES